VLRGSKYRRNSQEIHKNFGDLRAKNQKKGDPFGPPLLARILHQTFIT